MPVREGREVKVSGMKKRVWLEKRFALLFMGGIAMVSIILLCAAAAASNNSRLPRTIIDEWKRVKLPSPPKLEAVTVDPEKTALLILDVQNQNCNENRHTLKQRFAGDDFISKALVM